MKCSVVSPKEVVGLRVVTFSQESICSGCPEDAEEESCLVGWFFDLCLFLIWLRLSRRPDEGSQSQRQTKASENPWFTNLFNR